MGPDPAVAAVRGAVRRVLAGEPAGPVLVACSGGADSLALLAATVFEGRRRARSAAEGEGRRVLGVTVDHGLQDGSAERAVAVVAQMAGLGVDETASVRVRVEVSGRGVEAAAREARYDVLAELAARLGTRTVLLGHTLDDQAETVLMGLTRGSGGRSIAGMRRSFQMFRRPLLDLTRTVTRDACRAEGIPYWEDPHNADPRFLRSRVRHRVLPVLEEELGPGVAATLARTADLLRADMEHLDALADEALAAVTAGPAQGLDVVALAGLPAPVRTRVLRLAALRAGAVGSELFHAHVVELDRLVTDWRGQSGVDLPGQVRAVRRGGVLGFDAAP